ncbi:MAG: hypothetical protein SGPRY_013334, partial [Prymnesium sp.]
NAPYASLCAACEAPRPSLPPSEEEQLALAIAASRKTCPAPGLNMAQAAEEEAIRKSEEEAAAQLRAKVEPSVLRIAGDSRGTASTLVGLSAEDELELALLKSRIAAEQPTEPPRQVDHPPHAQYPQQTASSDPLKPLSAPAMPRIKPPIFSAPKKPQTELKESLLIGEAVDGSDRDHRIGSCQSEEMQYRPPTLPVPAPEINPVSSLKHSETIGGTRNRESSEDDWDDSDSPLQPLHSSSNGGASYQEQRHARAGGNAAGYANLE